MRTVADMMKLLGGLPPGTPVQVGLVGPDGGRVVREIDAIEAREDGIVLLIEDRTPGEAPEAPVAHAVETDQTGEAVAAPPPAEAPGGPEGEGEEPAPPSTGGGRRGDGA
ncbi:MAG TPA: hypothetical protein VHN13_23060 [Candidatus Tectomicrobia bacterium]|jgi:hypothetical protein|nr:hypothetical protein [Candidatus Tectomicrobia bacterium]